MLISMLALASIFDRYPQKEEVRLSGSEAVRLPVHYQEFDMASLIGSADFERVSRELAPTGLEPLKFPGGKAMIVIYAFDYARSSLGSYREFVVGIPVANERTGARSAARSLQLFYSSFLPGFHAPQNAKGYSLYIHRIFVDSELGRKAGDELWDFHKSTGEIALSKAEDRFELSLRSAECSIQATVRARPRVFLPNALNFPLLTRGLKDAPTTGSAQSALGPARDRVTFAAGGECGQFLRDAGFRTDLWQYGINGKLILFRNPIPSENP